MVIASFMFLCRSVFYHGVHLKISPFLLFMSNISALTLCRKKVFFCKLQNVLSNQLTDAVFTFPNDKDQESLSRWLPSFSINCFRPGDQLKEKREVIRDNEEERHPITSQEKVDIFISLVIWRLRKTGVSNKEDSSNCKPVQWKEAKRRWRDWIPSMMGTFRGWTEDGICCNHAFEADPSSCLSLLQHFSCNDLQQQSWLFSSYLYKCTKRWNWWWWRGYSRFCMRMDNSRKDRPNFPWSVCLFKINARTESRWL